MHGPWSLSGIRGRRLPYGEFPQAHSPEVYKAALSPVLWVDNILLAPVVEELMLRGFLFDTLRRRGVATAVIVTGGIGSVLHLTFPQVLFVTPMQMILSYVRARTGTVSVCIVLHVAYNLAALVTTFLLASVPGSSPS
jgi:membrane protease YdiL (CAAX protease family)